MTYILSTAAVRGSFNQPFYWALVDSSIIIDTELADDPLDAGDGDQWDKDEPSEEDSTLLSKHTKSYCKFDNITCWI